MSKNNIPQIKNEDQYEKLRDHGMSKEKAARIANTENSSEKGGRAKNYEDRTKKELMDKAKQIGIKGRSSMNKKELIKAIRDS